MLEQRVNVPKLLDPEEVRGERCYGSQTFDRGRFGCAFGAQVATGFVDERALVLYLSLIFHAFKVRGASTHRAAPRLMARARAKSRAGERRG